VSGAADGSFPAQEVEAAIAYCDTFTLDELPDDARNLLHHPYSKVMASFPVDGWGQQRVSDSGPACLDPVTEPGP
jgi:hypothetical protein